MNEPIYTAKQVIQRLSQALNLYGIDEFTQDWEYEAADPERLY